MTAVAEPDADEFAENVVPQLDTAPFVVGLTVLAKTLRDNPFLVETIWDVTPSMSSHLNLRVLTDRDVAVFELWALLLNDISTTAYRYDESVDGEICGLLNGVRVRIVGLIPSHAVPEGSGQHEWTLPMVTS